MTCLFLPSLSETNLLCSASAVCPLHFRHSTRGDSREGTVAIDQVNSRKVHLREQPNTGNASTQNGNASLRNSQGTTATPSNQQTDVRILTIE